MAGTVALGMYFESKNINVMFPRADVELVSPIALVPTVQASELVEASPLPTPTPSPEPKTEKEEIEAYIREVFGKDGERAVQIFTCESGLNPEVVGDKHLLAELDGEMIGDSIGIAQIRTGNKAGTYDKTNWNRAKANGMSVEEFRTYLKDYKNNIDYAKKMFDRAGSFKPWFNCMNKTR